jgi:acyl-coenzyme A thioesterase PaaI-like protein
MRTVHGGPEALFRVTDLTSEPWGATGVMQLGAWSTGADGQTALGALGVLADDVLGYAIVAHAPEGHWSVSIEITLDEILHLPGPGARLRADAAVLASDNRGAYAEGAVRDPAGRMLVRISQRARWVALDGIRDPHLGWDDVIRPDEDTPFADLLRVPGERTEPYVLRTDQAASNNMGAVHGGTAIAASAAVAENTIASQGPSQRRPLRVRSLRIHYPRPTVPDVPTEVRADIRYSGRSLALLDVTTMQAAKARTATRVIAE